MSQITAWWFFWLGGAGFLRLSLLPLLQQHPAVQLLKEEEEEEERICKGRIANMVSLSKIILENGIMCCYAARETSLCGTENKNRLAFLVLGFLLHTADFCSGDYPFWGLYFALHGFHLGHDGIRERGLQLRGLNQCNEANFTLLSRNPAKTQSLTYCQDACSASESLSLTFLKDFSFYV